MGPFPNFFAYWVNGLCLREQCGQPFINNKTVQAYPMNAIAFKFKKKLV